MKDRSTQHNPTLHYLAVSASGDPVAGHTARYPTAAALAAHLHKVHCRWAVIVSGRVEVGGIIAHQAGPPTWWGHRQRTGARP